MARHRISRETVRTFLSPVEGGGYGLAPMRCRPTAPMPSRPSSPATAMPTWATRCSPTATPALCSLCAVLSFAGADGQRRRAQLALSAQDGDGRLPLVRGARQLSLRAPYGDHNRRRPRHRPRRADRAHHQGALFAAKAPDRRAGEAGAAQLFGTSFAQYERAFRAQLGDMFARGGFDPRRDVAGIILNRWGHAYVSPQPGFFSGVDGKPAPRDVLRDQALGRIAFANTELAGASDHRNAIREAERGVGQISGL